MAKVKFDLNKAPHERIPKKTSIGRRPKSVHLNLTIHKENDIQILEDNVMEKIIETIKHFWTDHKLIVGIVIAAIIVAIIW